jgi:Domain of unknown function (DUF1906)
MVVAQGFDTSFNRPAYAQAAFLGKTFVCRYFGPGFGKLASRTEVAAWHAVGISVVALAERFERSALLGHAEGVRQAQEAWAGARAAGMPTDRPIYFAVDWDMQVADRPAVRAFLAGAASVIGLVNVGIYGGIRATEWAANNRYASWFFQTYAWSFGEWGPHADIQQYRNNVPFAGGVVDLDRAMSTDFGQWPHAHETIGPAPATPAPTGQTGPWDFATDVSVIAGEVRTLAATLAGAARSLAQYH